MKNLIWIVIFVSGCAAVDALDGDIESKANCCIKVTRSAVRSCVADFVEPGYCSVWHCPTTEGAVCNLHGQIVNPPKLFCELTPDVPAEWCENGEEN